MASTSSSSTEAEQVSTTATTPTNGTTLALDVASRAEAPKELNTDSSVPGRTSLNEDTAVVQEIETADSKPDARQESEGDSEDEQDLAEDLSREVRYKSLARTLDERRKTSKKRNFQAAQYLVLVEDRLKELESVVKDLQAQQSNAAGIEGDDDTKDEKPLTEAKKKLLDPVKVDWSRFSSPTLEQSKETKAVMELCTEVPFSFQDAKVSRQPARHFGSQIDNEKRERIQRIRINSESIGQDLQAIFDVETAPSLGEEHLRPFKALVPFVEDISARINHLEERAAKLATSNVSQPVALEKAPEEEQTSSSQDLVPTLSKDNDQSATTEPESTKAVGAEHNPATEREEITDAISHLTCLLHCLKHDLTDEADTHNILRSRHQGFDLSKDPARISFADLWHLFAPGDLVYDPTSTQALRVLAVRGGRQQLVRESKNRYDDMFGDREEPSSAEPGNVFAQLLGSTDKVSDFVLTCFYLDFNGECVGPVQLEKSIEPFDGVKEIKNLRVIPIEYADTQAFRIGRTGAGGATDITENLREILLARGRKYADLTRFREAAHRDYNGFSLGKVRDQIDSQIIIDLDLFYQKNPDEIPDLGLREPGESNVKEIQESYIKECHCGVKNCTMNFRSLIYDDRKVDRFRTNKFMAAHQLLVRFTEQSSQTQFLSREDFLVLFPRKIHAFVLRSRSWAALDVARICDLVPRPQSFSELVLPDKHKKIVEGLVKTHSRGARPVTDSAADKGNDKDGISGNGSRFVNDAAAEKDVEHREDLVRGKGKGVILLLHGVPGVGKTSTAECVAEYTGRPLFALTCGDVGDNAIDVEANLTENFQLAHRWGCVMLLDEADVFLQSRSASSDLARNAVVSVFLGMLEYYSGILFLTTNKVGTFDEAFKSRIHVSLYYKELDEKQTMEIWRLNLERIKKSREGRIDFEIDDMTKWMKKFYRKNAKERERTKKLRPWNGRQIKNACQTAAALAEFQNNGKITTDELDAVADASAQFDRYLMATYGKDDAGRAEERVDRGDDKYEMLTALLQGSAVSPKKTPRRRREETPPPPPRTSNRRKSKAAKEPEPEPEPESDSGSASDSASEVSST